MNYLQLDFSSSLVKEEEEADGKLKKGRNQKKLLSHRNTIITSNTLGHSLVLDS
jgi:hypothetical protein